MTAPLLDDLWPHFEPLWTDLRTIAPGVLLAGGYALFLKQQWLLRTSIPTLITISQWNDPAPRVTNDLDLVAELNLIASPGEQQRIDSTLSKHGFQVVERNRRWQFAKNLDPLRSIVIDFHASPPLLKRNDVRVESRRVKPHPSLGQIGIHGRENPEAAGCERHPFLFPWNDVEIAIPHPVSLLLMKLVATRDRRAAAHDASKTVASRNFEGAQAQKHAQDVGRVVAMITRDENDLAEQVLATQQSLPTFAAARHARNELFGSNEAWGTQVIARFWPNDDVTQIRALLDRWFRQ